MWTPLRLAREDVVVLLPCTQQDYNNAGMRLILWYDLSLTDGLEEPGTTDCL